MAPEQWLDTREKALGTGVLGLTTSSVMPLPLNPRLANVTFVLYALVRVMVEVALVPDWIVATATAAGDATSEWITFSATIGDVDPSTSPWAASPVPGGRRLLLLSRGGQQRDQAQRPIDSHPRHPATDR